MSCETDLQNIKTNTDNLSDIKDYSKNLSCIKNDIGILKKQNNDMLNLLSELVIAIKGSCDTSYVIYNDDCISN